MIDLDSAVAFLSTIFHGAPGLISLCHTAPKFRAAGFFPTDEAGINKAANVACALDGEVYIGCCTYRAGIEAGRGTLKDLVAGTAAWAELDVGAVGHSASTCPPTIADALALVPAAGLPEPSIVVSSGGGVHLWWILDRKDNEARAVGAASAAAQAALRDKAAQRGWHVDNLKDATRVLRVPGTWNRKAEPWRPVKILTLSSARYPLSTFSPLARPPSSGPTGTSIDSEAKAFPPEGGVVASGAGASGREATGKPIGIPALRERLKSVDDAQIAALLKGERISEEGDRNHGMPHVTGIVAKLAPFDDPEMIATDLFDPVIATQGSHTDKTKDPHDDVVRQLETYQQRERVEIAEREDTVAELNVQAGIVNRYTETELKRFAEKLGCTLDELEKRWVIQRGASHFVLVDGKYKSQIGIVELETSLPRDLLRAPIRWTTGFDSRGMPKKRSALDIVREHGSVARSMIATLKLQESRYEADTETFYEAVCPVREIAPEFHPKVDEWLRLMGGDRADKLLDWIAVVTQLDQQCCALYLSGRPGIGKGTLARGLAQIWSPEGVPTMLDDVVESFNEGISRCPIIWADESIDPTKKHKVSSAMLRQLIGSSVRPLKRKYVSNTELVGAIRLLMTANNDRMLELGENEDYSRDDLEAVAGRFLHIKMPDAAIEYLQNLGPEVNGWYADSKIARHALWLRDNRVVTKGKRFIVEGERGKMHEALQVQTRVANVLLEWLTLYLSDPIPQPAQQNLIEAGEGRLIVSPALFKDWWDKYVKHDKIPATKSISRTLDNWSTGPKQKIGKTNAFEIPADRVIQWAETNNVGSPEAIRLRVDGPAKNLRDAGIVSIGSARNGTNGHVKDAGAEADAWEDARAKGDDEIPF